MNLNTIKDTLKTFLSAIGILYLALLLLSNYESIYSHWLNIVIFLGITGTIFTLVRIFKVAFSFVITGSYLLFSYIISNLNLFDSKLINTIIVSIVLIILTEFLLSDGDIKNILLDMIWDCVFALILMCGCYDNIEKVIPESWASLFQLIVLFIFSVLLTMPNPSKWRRIKGED